jgi:hypothetical protein
MQKFKMKDSKAMATPMSTTTALDADEEGEHVDHKEYQSMIGSLLYLTATRPDRSLEPSLLVFSTPSGLTGDDLSRLFFNWTNTSQAATCTCNT